MASRKSSFRVQKHSRGITSILASAAFEWLLIFLLFLEAFFSYMVTRFARFCELQTPCLLCSRLDHIFGSEKPGFYWDLICHEHKLEISSLFYCCTHGKLNDIRGMCRSCVSSFPTKKVTDYETGKFAMGYIEYSVDDKYNICLKMPTATDGEELVNYSLLNDPSVSSFGLRQCSCCSQPSRVEIDDALETKSTGAVTTEVDVSGSRSLGPGHLHHQVSLKKRGGRSSVSAAVSYLEDTGFDPLSYVGYTELKITSDSESEVPMSDDDDGISLACEASDVRVDSVAQFLNPETRTIIPETLPETLSSDSVIEKLIHQSPMSKSLVSVPVEQILVRKPHGVSSVISVVDIGHVLEELNWHHLEERSNPSCSASEFLSSCGVSSVMSELIIPEEPHSSFDTDKHLVEASKEKMIGYIEHVPSIERKEVFKPVDSSTESDVKADTTWSEAASVSDCLDLNDAYKLAVGNKGNHLLIISKNFAGGHEDLKLLLSQISAARGFDLSWNDAVPTPRVLPNAEDVKPLETSSSIEMEVLKKKFSIERNESGVESLDFSLVNEFQGENGIDQLKQQIESDQKSMWALYKELEEERNAAAIAANQAMAMINRLQEEKAAVQMEALQYQRMMEEQAEYDQEALNKLNDLLTEKEMEVQVLEAEFEDYRRGIWKKLKGEKTDSTTGGEVGAVHNSHCGCNCHDNYSNFPCDHEKTEREYVNCKGNKLQIVNDTLFDFSKEKLYLLKCLNSLQKKVCVFYDDGDYVDFSGVNGNMKNFADANYKDTKKIVSNVENVQNSVATDSVANGGCAVEKGYQHTEWHEEIKPNGRFQRGDTEWLNRHDMKGNNQTDHDRLFDLNSTKSDLFAIVKEVSNLGERLTALEVERSFLDHSISSLQNGNEKLGFIQEIASNLREHRQIGVRSGEQAVA